MAIRHIRAAAPAAILVSCALASTASAATITAPACVPTYRDDNQPSVLIGGEGFTPLGPVTLAYVHPKRPQPELAKTVTANATGGIADVIFPAAYTSGTAQDQTFTLIARDDTNPANIASVQVRQVKAGFNMTPNPTRPTSRVTYTARGFTPGLNIYAHFRFRAKTYRTVKLGRASAPCGIASRKMRALPTKPRYGLWTVYIDQNPRYSPRTRPQASDQFTIYRKFT